MDFEQKEEKRYALRRIIWDIVLTGLALYFSYNLTCDFIAADRTAGWTTQSYFSLIGAVVFVAVAALLVYGLVKKIKKFKEEF